MTNDNYPKEKLTQPLAELLASLETDIEEGLSHETAAARLQRDGPNRVPLPPSVLQDPMTKAFADMLPSSVNVIRQGIRTQVPEANLVVGDIVILKAGSKAPADIRVVKLPENGGGLTVDMSPFTGEVGDLSRSLEYGNDRCSPMEANNLIPKSILITSGTGHGLVVATGKDCFVEKIMACIGMPDVRPPRPPRSIGSSFAAARLAKKLADGQVLVKSMHAAAALGELDTLVCIASDVLSDGNGMREGIPEAVQKLDSLGVRLVLATGDVPEKLKTLGVEASILTSGAEVLHASAFFATSEEDQKRKLLGPAEEVAIGRATSEDKCGIVRVLMGGRREGAKVGAIGSTLPDGRAFKVATVGICLGIAGSDAAKDPADVILLDDRFQTVATAIETVREHIANRSRSRMCSLM
uniref:Uncharacterized protein n=1 Tax=Chromera velia CCMP2878 TaxID=1169474 RepID=A0A0G4I470_9ALVE|eukprot:Cvel_10847.t1-p1 / transcript=Cvel_10847.t1 / gene=Cvel_10847 / organism=Chromera_velia_CCMP2878 / gene_product=Potassium-transporting ATPase alpha chain 2, putative / transcript_product=Potassium-transporting ATPase alpha chain 2, putative / location=Cvel_scaffold664:10111-12200(-) / protein_length=410 / sequence_SO=supercontig / SO=protein_coding / is_pseudo=false